MFELVFQHHESVSILQKNAKQENMDTKYQRAYINLPIVVQLYNKGTWINIS